MDNRTITSELTDVERYPGLTAHGQRMLDHLAQLPHAPLYRNRAGHRLTADDLAQVLAFETEVAQSQAGTRIGKSPPWLAAFVARSYADVPHFRGRGALPKRFEDLPTTNRADLANDIAAFVPDGLPLDRLINFRTSGTTGHPLVIPSHPVVAASYIAFHKRALQRFGIEPKAGRGTVGVVLLGHQQRCFTYVSVIPSMDEAGYAKVNLHPADWHDPDDRARYLDALQPEIFSGDPISFATLLELPLMWKPRALVSTSMTLTPALRAELEARFGCPVLDVVSMNEAGPIAVFDARVGGHVLLQHRLHVEILDDAGQPCAPGERGEVTLTGGFNAYLPLLRYRTGDRAAAGECDHYLFLKDFIGRTPVRFRADDGIWINNNDVTHALRDVPLRQFQLHQHADGRIAFAYAATTDHDARLTPALHALFGAQARVSVTRTTFEGVKVVQYSSDLPQ